MATLVIGKNGTVQNGTNQSGMLRIEISHERFARNTEWSYQDILNALVKNGFNPKLARSLCDRSAFIRAARRLAQSRLVRRVEEDTDTLRFQFTREFLDQNLGQLQYDCEAIVELDKSTSAVICKDKQLEALAVQEMARQVGIRKLPDVRRLINRIVAVAGDNYVFGLGSRMTTGAKKDVLDKLESFVRDIGGTMDRLQVRDDDPATAVTVATVVTESLMEKTWDVTEKVQKHLDDGTMTARIAETMREEISEQLNELHRNLSFCSAHSAILEDALALADKRIRDSKKGTAPVNNGAVNAPAPQPVP